MKKQKQILFHFFRFFLSFSKNFFNKILSFFFSLSFSSDHPSLI